MNLIGVSKLYRNPVANYINLLNVHGLLQDKS